MPSLADLAQIIPTAGTIAQGLAQNGAVNNATNALATGAQTGISTIGTGGTNAQNAIASGAQSAQNAINAGLSTSSGLLQPYQAAGTQALSTVQAGIAPGGGLTDPMSNSIEALYQDPSFQYRLNNGLAAINAQANQAGDRFSGATLKSANDYAGQSASQEFAAEDARYRQNQQDKLNAEMGLVSSGQNAANTNVAANTAAGSQLANVDTSSANAIANTQTSTADQIANLQTQLASAQAAGDIAKANTLTNTIKALTGAGGPLTSLASGAAGAGQVAAPSIAATTYGPAIPAGLSGGATSLADAAGLATGGAAAAGAGGADLAAGAASLADAGGGITAAGLGGGDAALSAIGASPIIGADTAAATTAGSAGAGGLGSAAIGFLGNPITIGVGAAILGITALLKSQAHWEANTLTQSVQNPFNQHLGTLVDGFDKALASGQLNKATASQIMQSTAAAIQQYTQSVKQFGSKGGDSAKVANQALETMSQNFGGSGTNPDWSKILGKMQGEIAGLSS